MYPSHKTPAPKVLQAAVCYCLQRRNPTGQDLAFIHTVCTATHRGNQYFLLPPRAVMLFGIHV